jgi:hypothetical protein
MKLKNDGVPGVSATMVWRVWHDEYLGPDGPNERHLLRSLMDEVELMHSRIEEMRKKRPTPAVAPARPNMNYSKKRPYLE